MTSKRLRPRRRSVRGQWSFASQGFVGRDDAGTLFLALLAAACFLSFESLFWVSANHIILVHHASGHDLLGVVLSWFLFAHFVYFTARVVREVHR